MQEYIVAVRMFGVHAGLTYFGKIINNCVAAEDMIVQVDLLFALNAAVIKLINNHKERLFNEEDSPSMGVGHFFGTCEDRCVLSDECDRSVFSFLQQLQFALAE